MEYHSGVGTSASAGAADTPEISRVLPEGSAGPASPSRRKRSPGAPEALGDKPAAAQVPVCWPFTSSHYREWLFSAEQLREKRLDVHAKALKLLEEADPALAAGAPGADELLQLQRYFALQLLLIFQKKGLKAYALETACLFFHRFFLSVSPLEVDVRLALFACLLLALKAIDVARHYTLGELLGDIEDLDLEAVVALELPVCEGLRFQLLTLHTREPLNELVSILVEKIQAQFRQQEQQLREKHAEPQNHQQQQELQQQQPQQNNTNTGTSGSSNSNSSSDNNSSSIDDNSSSSNDNSSSSSDSSSSNSSSGNSSSSNNNSLSAAFDVLETKHISLLSQLVRLQEDAEASCLLMHASPSLPLRHPPSQLALAGLLGSPVRRDLLQQGLDIEAILKQHIISLTQQTSETAAAAAPAAAAGAPARNKEGEAPWASIQKCVESIVEEVRSMRQLQKQTQGGAVSHQMADLLGKAIDAAEVLESRRKGEGAAESRREKKKRRKQKKTKKDN